MQSSDNVNAPQLLGAHVTPTIGTNTTIFNFSVEYADIDGDMPDSINITLDGSVYNMTVADVGDVNVTDGKNYTYSTLLPWGLHQYQIRCYDGLFNAETLNITAPDVNPFPVYFGNNITMFQEDFEGATQFTQGGTGAALWHITNGSSAWPDPYHSASHAAWCGAEGTGAYDDNMSLYFVSPSIDLSDIAIARLEFYHWMETVASTDTCDVQISTSNFTTFETLYSNSGSLLPWEKVSIDISSYARLANVRLRFFFQSDASLTGRGWYVDDIRVSGTKRVDLAYPANGANFFNGDITVACIGSRIPVGSTNFTTQYSQSSNFSTGVLESAGIPLVSGNTLCALFVNGSNGVYYWRVKATYLGSSSNWSAVRWFNMVHNDHLPVLNCSADTQVGDELTTFTLDVTYTDRDGNAPSYVQVLLDGIYYSMAKVNASDTDYADGCLYRCDVSGLSRDSYTCQFQASDGQFFANPVNGSINVLQANLLAPQLTAASVSPATGANTTTFSFSVLYTDAENSLPESIFITINSTTYPMSAVDPGDLNVTDGKWYSFATVLPWGNYTYRINCSDDKFSNATTLMTGPVVSPFYNLSYTPLLLSPANASSSFEGSITFTWTSLNSALVGPVQYTWQMSSSSTFGSIDIEVIGIGEGVTTTSRAILVDIGPGLHYWRVRPVSQGFSGTWSAASEITMILNDNAPTLTAAGVSPGTGDQFTIFNFSATYTDLDNNTPVNVNAYINGTAHVMSKQDPFDMDFTDGCVYVYSATFPQVTTTFVHYFSCSDGLYSNATASTVGPAVAETYSNIPQLINVYVTPGAGINSTAFNFSVVYVDGDNNLPSSVTMTVNATTYLMVADNAADTNVVDGKGYHFVTSLPWGVFQFRVNCSDGLNENATGWILGPQVNPLLAYPDFVLLDTPGDWDDEACGNVTFSWISQVLEPSLPTTFRWQLSNSSLFTSILDEVSGIPETSASINITRNLTLHGAYYWRVRPEVLGFVGDWHAVNMFILSWSPILTNGLHSPFSGSTGTNFTFQITYIDLDDDEPYYIEITIDSVAHSMSKQNDSDYNFTDGVLYIFSTILNPGNHSYYFETYDGIFYTTNEIQVGPTVTNTPPALTSGFVTPETGPPTTIFNFSVVYTDIENNAPAYVRFHWDGSWSTMTKQNASDTNYQDGCIYYSLHYLAPIAHTYYFSASDGFDTNSTEPQSGPNVINYAPVLTEPSVTPTSGTRSTLFLFNVTYSDADNNAPLYIWVYIDGSRFEMLKQNSSDTNYTNGCIYLYNTTMSLVLHSYFFTATDGYVSSTTCTFPGPTMINRAPTLSSGSVSQATGNVRTLFTFNVIYTDADNDLPYFIRINLDGTFYDMQKQNNLDDNLADGCKYIMNVILAIGTHNYMFYASDGYYSVSTISCSGPVVTSTNTAPTLSGGVLFPTSGNTLTTFIFRVVYTDAENDQPSFMRVYIDGSFYNMNDENSSDITYTDGHVFIYTRTLASGTHNYQFYAEDGFTSVLTSLVTGPTVSTTNTAPTLTSGSISQTSGNDYSVFIYRVVYTDTQNNAPSYMRVYIDGISYSMGKENGMDNTYSDGCAYIYSRTLAVGSHTYYFSASDGSLTASTSTSSAPTVSTTYVAPVLSSPQMSPINGTTATTFTYTVTYTNAFNSAPVYMRVYIDGIYYAMSKQNASDVVYTDGCKYIYSRLLTLGNHTYYFAANGGFLVDSTTSVSAPLVVVCNPTLIEGGLSPGTGNINTVFNFSVTYTDARNNLPSFMRVYIDGSSYNMIKQNSSDLVYANGCRYYYTRNLAPGAHTYYFSTNNGETTVSTSSASGPTVTNTDPTLTSYNLTPTSGIYSTLFTYNVTYADAENSPPSYMRLYIDGTLCSMTKQDAGDVTYTDGCVYLYSTSLAVGSHSYYFATSDGYATTTTSTSSGPTILNTMAPQLVNPQVSPTTGINTTTFNFTVIYYDADNQLPTSITVTINGSTYTMTGAVPADTNVVDGKVYSYSRTLTWGIYRFRMNCSDGTFQNGTVWKYGLSVNPFGSSTGNVTVFQDDFESGTSKWTTLSGLWHITTDYSYAATHSLWCASESTNQYTNNLAAEAISIGVDLRSYNVAYLELYHWITTEAGCDYCMIYVRPNSGSSWTQIYSTSTTISSWQKYTYDISSYCTSSASAFQLRFYFTSDYSVLYRGWLIDNVKITASGGNGLPVLTQPADGSYVGIGDNVFAWKSATIPTGTVTYQWQLSASSTFGTILEDVNNIPNTPTTTSITRNITRASGTYYWRVRPVAFGCYGNWTMPGYFYLRRAPSLLNTNLYPAMGNTYTAFIYRVVYTHPDNYGPSIMRVYIDGSYYSMSKQNSSDNTYTDGCTYIYSRTLSTGTHNYYFYAYDGFLTATTTTYSGPSVSTTNTVPSLSSGSVSPGTGNPYSSFVFQVLYTDAENNAPSSIYVYIDGNGYSMSKQNSSDINYTDGCIYVYSRTLSTGTHNYYFYAADGALSTSTSTFTGPVVSSSNTTPVLSSVSVSPASGLPTVTFTYSITYTDAENNAPNYMYVYIDGSGGYSMWKQNSSDLLYVDGCIYIYTSTLMPGSHTYYFYAADAYTSTSTSTYTGPSVINTQPSLTSSSVSPSSGNTLTNFIYSVVYTDAENNAPSYIYVYIDGNGYTMSKQNSSDVTYTDGCAFVYSRTLSPTSHNYYFSTSDGYVSTSTTTSSGPTVTNNAPTLTLTSVSPSTGNMYTTFTFNVSYTDADNNAPSYMRVYIDSTYYSMSKVNAGDVTYSDGCSYTYSTTLAPTSHTYYFSTSDGYATSSSPTYSGPTVTNAVPTLTSSSVSPASGTTLTIFTYTVTFTDADNNAPSYMRVYIDSSYSTMSKQNSGDVTYTDGCIYVYSTTLAPTSHTYYFSTSDGYVSTSTATYSGPTVTNNAPTLTSGSVSPSSGVPTTTFTYTVTYTDSDNNGPSYIYVYIDGSAYSMSKQNSGDVTYTDGCIYVYSRTLLPVAHNYYFSTSDGYLTTTTSTYSGPTVTNNAPTLTSGSVSPSSGVPTTTFTYTVTYTDADNNAPSYMRVYIDSTYYTMSKQNSADITYTDGCVYVYSRALAPASHNYYFSTSDGYATNTTTTFYGPTVTNNAPTLTSFSVSPPSGSTTTTFTYTVTYTDADNNAPSYVVVVIDGNGYTMSKQNSGDTTYTDGCIYVYSRTLSSGSHTYYFYANDGYTTTTTSSYSGPTVQANRAPTLTSTYVSPSTGDGNTQFTFKVTYTDADNNAPYYIYVYIDGSSKSMLKQDVGDNVYTDGCVYVYTTLLSLGSRSYYFKCSDGSSTTTSSSQSVSVTRYSTTQTATTTILVLVFLVGIPLFIGITATAAYNKKKGIKKGTSTSVYRRPSPSFTPAASTSSTYSPSGSSSSGFDVTRSARRTDLRALPAPRTSPLSRKELIARVGSILKKRQVSTLPIDDPTYDQQLIAYTATFLASWRAPGEDLAAPVVPASKDVAALPSSTGAGEPVMVSPPASSPGGDALTPKQIDPPVDVVAGDKPSHEVSDIQEGKNLEVSDIESELMGMIHPTVEPESTSPEQDPAKGQGEMPVGDAPAVSNRETPVHVEPPVSSDAELPKWQLPPIKPMTVPIQSDQAPAEPVRNDDLQPETSPDEHTSRNVDQGDSPVSNQTGNETRLIHTITCPNCRNSFTSANKGVHICPTCSFAVHDK